MLKEPSHVQSKLMVLWIFVKLNVISADLLGFLQPFFLKELITSGTADGLTITPWFLLTAAILLEINIAMVLISRLAPMKINRRLNIIAPIIVALFIVGGGSFTPHYIFFASLELIALFVIIRTALAWQ